MSTQSTEGEDVAREDAIGLGGTGDDLERTLGEHDRFGTSDDALELEDEDEGKSSPLRNSQQDERPPSLTQAPRTPPLHAVNDSPSFDGSNSEIPDDTPSIQGSLLSISRSDALLYRSPSYGRSPSGTHRPFDRRFQSRLSSSPLSSPRASSPAFLGNHSRQSSIASVAFPGSAELEPEPTSAPWEVIRWTKLRKVTGQAFSEIGKRNFGRPTCVAISTNIIIGTSKGIVLVFDYQQVHKAIIGPGTQAVECGAVVALAVSADHSTVASGHTSGHIFTWEIARAARPFLHIPPVEHHQGQARTSDGHVPGASILHLGFLGARRTALVSADERGMAFSHLATRGLGSVARAMKTTRILGRYPDLIQRDSRPRKPSSVLAFSPLPLGNIEQASDGVGLVAMMTPYLLVIVSTTPIAQTQHKAARPKEVRAHGVMSAALAWFPAIKLKGQESDMSRTKLVYCWSNVLTILDVDEVEPSEPAGRDKPPEFLFETRSRWTADEAIVAVQWLSRSVLAVLTVTQQLFILEDQSMRVTDSFDLLQKNIYHTDLFSQQLHAVVEQLDEEDTSMHGVVADAFYMSFRAYKGRLFLLGFNDISIGSLSNWADRLLALMERGDFIAALRLATDYYLGNGEKITIGLPEDEDSRHDVVRPKLVEMISASLRYAFGRNQQAEPEQLEKPQLAELAGVCISACISLNDRDFLFEEVFTWYEEHDMTSVFLDTLEPYIISGEVRALPPPAVKALIEHYLTNHTVSDLEDIICLLDTSSMDIDQVTTLCKRNSLYDAYIHVWTKTLDDFVGPLQELLSMAETPQANGHDDMTVQRKTTALKCFPYLSFILTGRQYPGGFAMPDDISIKAKAQVYTFLFSGRPRSELRTLPAKAEQPNYTSKASSFPHLKSILSLDAADFMSVLNEAFEDTFLNDASEQLSSGAGAHSKDHGVVYNKAINRQFIVSILLEVMTPPDFDPEDTIFLDMFLARNLPKYPQYILLSGTTLHQVLVRLCHFPSEDLAEECQLSVEYLLSVYHPPDLQSLVPTFEGANFYRVLKYVFKSERQYSQLVETYFKDREDEEGVFDTLLALLSSGSEPGLTDRQRREVEATVEEHADDLLYISIPRTALTIDHVLPQLHAHFLETLDDDPQGQFEYLRSLFEPDETTFTMHSKADIRLTERYVQLMCQYNPKHVREYVDKLRTSDLDLKQILPALESSGIIDAAVILLVRQGQVKGAMERLKRHLETLEAALTGIMKTLEESPDVDNTDEAIGDLLESLDKYAKVGIWLCQRQTNMMPKTKARANRRTSAEPQALSFEETLWLDLVNAVVKIARNILPSTEKAVDNDNDDSQSTSGYMHVTTALRATVQQVFTALLTATTAAREGAQDRADLSFLRILRGFLSDAVASSPSLSQLRAVISSIFAAYAYEESLLFLASEMLNKDLFVHVDEVSKLRQQGWRPRSQTCEICRRRVWGPGSGGQIWTAWQKKQARDLRRRQEKIKVDEVSRGKGKAIDDGSDEDDEEDAASGSSHGNDMELSAVMVFACRHLYHQGCLQQRREEEDAKSHMNGGDGSGNSGREEERQEVVCPICNVNS